MSATKTKDAKVVQLLNEAYGKERQLESRSSRIWR